MPEEPFIDDVELPEAPDTPICSICRSNNQEGMTEVFGETRCQSCQRDATCQACETQMRYADNIRVDEAGDRYCDECSFYCDHHQEVVAGEPNTTIGEEIICDSCAEENYMVCTGCDMYAYYEDVSHYITEPGQDASDAEAMCSDCIGSNEYTYNPVIELYTPPPTPQNSIEIISGVNYAEINRLASSGIQIRVPGQLPPEIFTRVTINTEYINDYDLNGECRNGHTVQRFVMEQGNEGYCRRCIDAFEILRSQGVARENNTMPQYTKIASYHSHTYGEKDFLYMAKDKKENNTMYFGIELETSFSSDHFSGEPGEKRASRILAELKGTFVGERDGTVSNGAELISKPLSYEYLTSKTMMNRLEKAFKLMKELGAINGTHNGIGLHIHVSRMPFKSETKATVEMEDDMNWFVNCFKDYVEVISKRKATNYCKFPIQQLKKPAHASRMYVDKKVLQKGSHGYALNLTQSRTPTYEFRVFNSTQDLEQLIASVEFVRNLSLFVINEPTIIGKTFRDIVMYKPTKYLKGYVNKLAAQYPEQMKGWKTVKLKPEIEVK